VKKKLKKPDCKVITLTVNWISKTHWMALWHSG